MSGSGELRKSVKTRLFVHICGGDACDMGFTEPKNLATKSEGKSDFTPKIADFTLRYSTNT